MTRLLPLALCFALPLGLVALPAAHAQSFQGLGDLSGGTFESVAWAVSADGRVVVGHGTSASGREASRWTAAGGMVGLGDLAGGPFFSIANAVSADGTVIVGIGTSAASAADGGREAFRWTSAGMVGLGDLPGGTFRSLANAASADGSVVVGYGTSATTQEAFIWTAANGMRNLRDVLVGLGLNLTGWTLLSATAITPDGRVIVGGGTNPSGQTEAFLAVLGPATAVEAPVSARGLSLAVAPNPTRGAATLALALALGPAGPVRVEVYGVLGPRVAVLHDGPTGAGAHTLALDLDRLAPGVYVVRASTPTAVAVQRVTVVR